MNADASAIALRALELDGEPVQTVNARDLHAFLTVRRDFTNWIRKRIERYGFVENRDFVCAPVLASKGRGGHNRWDYHLSLDMAKELAMVERTDRGKQARAYFIECERRAKGASSAPVTLAAALEDPVRLRELLLGSVDKQLELKSTILAQAPKVAALERISTATGDVSITRAAKLLQMSPMRLFQWMASHAWIYRPRPSGIGWIAYQPRIAQGVLVHKVITVPRSDGSQRLVEQVLVTSKGLTRLAQLLVHDDVSDEDNHPSPLTQRT